MAQLIRESSGETVHIPEGENIIGRGPLLKVKTYSVQHATAG